MENNLKKYLKTPQYVRASNIPLTILYDDTEKKNDIYLLVSYKNQSQDKYQI